MITILLGFSAVNTGNSLLFLVVSGLLAFMSVTGIAGMWNLKKLDVEITPPAELYATVAAPFTVRISNGKSLLPSFLLLLESWGKSLAIPVCWRNASYTATISLTFDKRGYVQGEHLFLRSPYPVGFFVRWLCFEAPPLFVVFPQMIPCGSGGDGDRSAKRGQAPQRSRGLDGELERIGDYSGSEPMRMIHWKASARCDTLLVKEFGTHSAQPLIIELDRLPGTLEERISRAAWMVRHWTEIRPVGLLLPGGVTHLPQTGRQHRLKLLKELALYGTA